MIFAAFLGRTSKILLHRKIDIFGNVRFKQHSWSKNREFQRRSTWSYKSLLMNGQLEIGERSKNNNVIGPIDGINIPSLFSNVISNCAMKSFFPVSTFGTIIGSVVENVFLSYVTGNFHQGLTNFVKPLQPYLIKAGKSINHFAKIDPLRDMNESQVRHAIDPWVSIYESAGIDENVASKRTTIADQQRSHIAVDINNGTFSGMSPRSKLPLPLMNLPTIGIAGNWKKVGENAVLYPPTNEMTTQPPAVLHFLGGSLVGAVPHLTYRLLLESLGALGYVIVATPYNVTFDHLATCDSVLQQYELAKEDIIDQYGFCPPVIGIGHSGGALLHMFISSFFHDDVMKDGNIFLGINDRQLTDAIPAFQEMISPVVRRVIVDKSTSQSSKSLDFMRRFVDAGMRTYADSSVSPLFFSNDIMPLVREGLAMVDQIPPLLKSIANGSFHYNPPSQQARDSFRLMYRTKHTLLVKLTNDTNDGSVEFERILNEANTIMKMKHNRNLDHMMVDSVELPGHGGVPYTQSITANISDISTFFKASCAAVKFSSKSHKDSLQSLNSIIKYIDKYVKEVVASGYVQHGVKQFDANKITISDLSKKNNLSKICSGDYEDKKEDIGCKDLTFTKFATTLNDVIHNITIITTPTSNKPDMTKIISLPGLERSHFAERVLPISKTEVNFRLSLTSLIFVIRAALNSIFNQIPLVLQHMVIVSFLFYFPKI